jgi:hypothetical protein
VFFCFGTEIRTLMAVGVVSVTLWLFLLAANFNRDPVQSLLMILLRYIYNRYQAAVLG